MTDIPAEQIVKTHATDGGLLDIVVCPITKTTLRYDAEKQQLISEAAKLSFPIRDGIPILLIDEAERLSSF